MQPHVTSHCPFLVPLSQSQHVRPSDGRLADFPARVLRGAGFGSTVADGYPLPLWGATRPWSWDRRPPASPFNAMAALRAYSSQFANRPSSSFRTPSPSGSGGSSRAPPHAASASRAANVRTAFNSLFRFSAVWLFLLALKRDCFALLSAFACRSSSPRSNLAPYHRIAQWAIRFTLAGLPRCRHLFF